MYRKSVYFLIVAVAVLIVIGCVMLFSTSAFAQDSHGNPHFFIKRQFIWLGVGTLCCIVAANIDYHFWQRTWWIWFAASFVLLALCFVPPIGMRINGSARWINLRFFQFQPSELGKFAAITALASPTKSGSAKDLPIFKPAASMKVLAMPPPTISWSTFFASACKMVSLVLTLLPATMAASGRLGLAKALVMASISADNKGPAQAMGANCAMP